MTTDAHAGYPRLGRTEILILAAAMLEAPILDDALPTFELKAPPPLPDIQVGAARPQREAPEDSHRWGPSQFSKRKRR